MNVGQPKRYSVADVISAINSEDSDNKIQSSDDDNEDQVDDITPYDLDSLFLSDFEESGHKSADDLDTDKGNDPDFDKNIMPSCSTNNFYGTRQRPTPTSRNLSVVKS